MGKGNRIPDTTPYHRQPVIDADATTGRVVVIETLRADQDIVRVSIETARSERLPERVIVF